MTVNLPHLLLLGILASSIHWLVARSKIAEPFWSHTKGFVDELLRCPACSGFWLGLFLGMIGVRPVDVAPQSLGVLLAGVLAVFLTPVFEAVLLWGLEMSAVADVVEPTAAQPDDTDAA
jgi:hypothetical protein